MNSSFILRSSRTIMRHTTIQKPSLVPEIKMRLASNSKPIWNRNWNELEQTPFSVENLPYWAFCWSGGQAVSRYLIDNPNLVRNKNVLDLGAGCGIGMLASKMCGAKKVVVNDIDGVALVSSFLNFKINFPSEKENEKTKSLNNDDLVNNSTMTNVNSNEKTEIIFSDQNFLSKHSLNQEEKTKFDLIIVGDLFYDSSFASELLQWLIEQKTKNNSMILIGDPMRANFKEREHFKITTSYSKPQNEHSELEDHHLSKVFVYSL